MEKPEGKDLGEGVIKGFEVLSFLFFFFCHKLSLAQNKILLSSCFNKAAVSASTRRSW